MDTLYVSKIDRVPGTRANNIAAYYRCCTGRERKGIFDLGLWSYTFVSIMILINSIDYNS